MREPAEVVSGGFPRPGRALRGVLIALAVSAIVGAIVFNWLPGPPLGGEIFSWIGFDPEEIFAKPWKIYTLLTSGILTSPRSAFHVLFALVGLYFLTPDLEKRWGGRRLLRFLATSVVMGNLMVLLVDVLPLKQGIFHPGFVIGPGAAIAATAIAWAMENAHRQIRLFMFLPISGRALYWLTIGFAVLSIIFMEGPPEGVAASFGGILAGILFGETPSKARSAWLRIKLALLRRKGHSLTVESIMAGSDRPRAPKRSGKGGGPPLRVVQGGLDDDDKRKGPKDKRFLN